MNFHSGDHGVPRPPTLRGMCISLEELEKSLRKGSRLELLLRLRLRYSQCRGKCDWAGEEIGSGSIGGGADASPNRSAVPVDCPHNSPAFAVPLGAITAWGILSRWMARPAKRASKGTKRTPPGWCLDWSLTRSYYTTTLDVDSARCACAPSSLLDGTSTLRWHPIHSSSIYKLAGSWFLS